MISSGLLRFASPAAKAQIEKTANTVRAAFLAGPAVTKDGTRIALNVNIASADELDEIDPVAMHECRKQHPELKTDPRLALDPPWLKAEVLGYDNFPPIKDPGTPKVVLDL